MACTAIPLLLDYVKNGLLDPLSKIDVLTDNEVEIVHLQALRLHEGIGRTFLKALKSTGVRVHVVHPLRAALPFWRKMWQEGLIDDDPATLQTWEDFLEGLESQMTVF